VPHAHELHLSRLTATERIALRVGGFFGSVPMFIACALWLSLAFLVPHMYAVVFFVSSGVIQLMALPLLGIGSNLISKQSEARADADYQVNVQAYQDTEAILAAIAALNVKLEGLHGGA
jgi:uncharacterized membrane protein